LRSLIVAHFLVDGGVDWDLVRSERVSADCLVENWDVVEGERNPGPAVEAQTSLVRLNGTVRHVESHDSGVVERSPSTLWTEEDGGCVGEVVHEEGRGGVDRESGGEFCGLELSQVLSVHSLLELEIHLNQVLGEVLLELIGLRNGNPTVIDDVLPRNVVVVGTPLSNINIRLARLCPRLRFGTKGIR